MPIKNKIQAPWEVMEEVLERGDAQVLAVRFACSPQTIRNWCREPVSDNSLTATGRPSPLRRVVDIVEQIKEDDGRPDRAYPIGRCIAAALDGVFVPLESAANIDSEFFKYCSEVMRESSEAIDEARVAWCEVTPGRISKREAVRIERECQEAMAALYRLTQWAAAQATRND